MKHCVINLKGTLLSLSRLSNGYLLKSIEVFDHRSSFGRFPQLLLLICLAFYLSKTGRFMWFLVSLCRSSRVSRYWRHVCSEPMLWRALCQLPREFRLCSAEAESSQLRSHTSECGTVRWKDAFSERYRLWRNWHAGRYFP